MKAEQLRQDLKHRKQQDTLRERNQAAAKELEQLQTEKRRMLMEHETQKMKELEDQYKGELHEWKGQLRPRKQVRFPLPLFYQLPPYTSQTSRVVEEISFLSSLSGRIEAYFG